ncbi:hypothetical protein R6Q57_013378 [Mikania cordata]
MKKDRSGSHFGVVRFPPVDNVNDMERKLNRVVIENLKVSVNLAKFERDGSAKDIRFKNPTSVHSIGRNVQGHYGGNGIGKSFRDVVLNSPYQSGEKELHLNSYRPQALAVWVNTVLIGRATDLQTLCGLGVWVKQNNGVMGLRYLGGLNVMIQLSGMMHAEKFISETHYWDAWFSKLYRWDGKPIPFERIALLKVYGVPPLLWNPVVFNNFGKIWGSGGYQSMGTRLCYDRRLVPESDAAGVSPMEDGASEGEMDRRMGSSNAAPDMIPKVAWENHSW